MYRESRVLCGAVLLALLAVGPASWAQTATATTLVVTPGVATAGAVVTMTATVTPATPGLVRFKADGSVLDTVPLVSGAGTATLKTRALAGGKHSISAEFVGTVSSAASASAAQEVTVQPSLTNTGMVLDGANPVALGDAAQFTATVVTNGRGSLAGDVSLLENGDSVIKGALAAAELKFSTASGPRTGTNPFFMKTGDLNADGVLDLVVSNSSSGRIQVFKGNADGTFNTAVLYSAGSSVRGIALGDFNQDGKLDLAVVNSIAVGTATILLGNGDGTFQAGKPYANGGAYPWAVAAADMNKDGVLDLAITNFGATANGTTVSVMLGQGNGAFTQKQNATTLIGPRTVAIDDFDGDGLPDMAVTEYGAKMVSVLKGNGDGTFGAQVPYPTETSPDTVMAADFNGDSRPDLAVSEYGSDKVGIFLNNGSGFQPKVDYATGKSPYGLAVADFDDNGKLDFVVANRNTATAPSTVSIFLGNGDGSFQPRTDVAAGLGPVAVTAGDFNGSGKADIAVANNDTLVVMLSSASAKASLSVASLSGGDHTLSAQFDGNDVFGVSESSTVTQTVLRGDATIVLQGTDTVYGQGASVAAVVARANGISSSAPRPGGTVTLKEGERVVAVATLDASGVAQFELAALQAGPHVFVAEYAGDASYNGASTLSPLTLAVAKATLTVKADDAKMAPGSTLPGLTVSYSGFVNGDTSEVLSGGPIVTTAARSGSPVGVYPIQVTAGTLSSANYSFVFINGTLTVGRTALVSFSLAPGTYSTAKTLTLSNSTPGAVIHFTTDGSAPTAESPVYTGPITIATTTTVKAFASTIDFADSAVTTATYTIVAPLPAFSPGAGKYTGAQTVTLSTAPGATIYYTTDGSTPTTASNVYTGPISVSTTTTIRAMAAGGGFGKSSVVSASYTIVAPLPTFWPAPSTYTSAQAVTITCANNATVYYTTDGATPTAASTQYAGPIPVSSTTVIRAIAVGGGLGASAVATGTYTIKP